MRSAAQIPAANTCILLEMTPNIASAVTEIKAKKFCTANFAAWARQWRRCCGIYAGVQTIAALSFLVAGICVPKAQAW